MTIGEKITALRTSHDMSQGDLAEKLNVSRQSISKWETNTSIPELDKLIQLSDLFHISIDELVRDNDLPNDPGKTADDTNNATLATFPQPDAVPTSQPQIIMQRSISTQKVIGFILLGIGLLCCILALLLGSGLAVIGGYVVLCSIFCLLLKKYAGLVIGWVSFFVFSAIAPYVTSVNLHSVFHPYFYQSELTITKILTVALWVLLALLIFLSYRAFRKHTQSKQTGDVNE